MQKKHFFLGDNIAKAREYQPHRQVFAGQELPQRDRQGHADFIKSRYEMAVNSAISILEEREKTGKPSANGIYVDLEMQHNFAQSQYAKREGATIMKVSPQREDGNVDVTVFVKKEKKDWLSKKADIYKRQDTAKGHPKLAATIAPIANVVTADIHSLYTSADEFNAIPDESTSQYEIWINRNSAYDYEQIKRTLGNIGFGMNAHPLDFESVTIWLVSGTKSQLRELPYALDYIEGVRPYKQPSILVGDRDKNREWCSLLASTVPLAIDDNSVQIGLLDSGVNNSHELLRAALPDDRMSTAINVQDSIDHSFHGTDMAGLILYGDLTDVVYQRRNIEPITHVLSSVKIIEDRYQTDVDFYGAVIEDSINQATDFGASIHCMAVTDEDSYDGTATSSSAALDMSIYNNGYCDRLVVVSAGNIESLDVDSEDYLESCKANTVKSPAQAWNALTVGAYTEKTIFNNNIYKAIAAPGGVSPYSRSSWMWHYKCNKPEIVMEGGNVVSDQYGITWSHNEVSLVTTNADLSEPLETFQATSAATALAARLAAKIKTNNPRLSMLSVRGLIVHAAHWTGEMNRIQNLDERMSLCGYGVPNEELALFSNEKCATYIFENSLVPFIEVNGSCRYNQLHYYALPWPSEVLAQMGEERVRMRITLSYYVQPSPSLAGRNNKYRYPSATLHFDVKRATETPEEFLSRHSSIEGERTTDNDTNRWAIKQTRRARGTVQSDWIECTATELADLDQIVVLPSTGWWKERKLRNVDNLIKYSLIVSIETKETEIYSAVETAIANAIGVQIMQET